MIFISKKYLHNLDDCKMAVNNAFLSVFQNIKKYKNEVPIKNWISKIVVNSAIDLYRKQKKQSDIFIDIETVKQMQDYNLPEINYDTNQILQKVNSLKEMEKSVLLLFAIEGFSHKEIAGLLRITETSSRWYLKEARIKLKNILFKRLGEGA